MKPEIMNRHTGKEGDRNSEVHKGEKKLQKTSYSGVETWHTCDIFSLSAPAKIRFLIKIIHFN